MIEKEEYLAFIRNRITELRINKNISEYQLSYDLGKSKSYIQSITSGATLPSMDAFIDICAYFEISPTEFFDKDFHKPEKIREALLCIESLSEKDLDLVLSIIKRLSNKS